MKEHTLIYSLMGTGCISIQAKSRLLAEEAFYDMSLNDLLLYADFSDGLELMSIEM